MRGRWNCRVLSLLGLALGLGLTFFLLRGLVRWPTDWILFLEKSQRPTATGFGPWGDMLLGILEIPLLSAGVARSLMEGIFGASWFLVFLMLPLRGWKVWEGLLWGAIVGSSLLFVAEGPAILGNRSLFLPLVFLFPLLGFFVPAKRDARPWGSLVLGVFMPLCLGIAAGFVSLYFLGPHLPWGELVLVLALFWARRAGTGALVSGGFFLLTVFGMAQAFPLSSVLDPAASLVDLLGPGPVWRTSLFQLLPAALGFRVFLGAGRQAHPLWVGGLGVGLSLFLVLGIGNVRRWRKISPLLQRERQALTAALSKLPSVGTVLVWNLPSFLRADFAVQSMGTSARFLLVNTWDLGEEVHIPESWGFSEKTPVLRWTAAGFTATRFEDCLLLPPFPLALKSGFARTPFAMVRMGRVPETKRLDEEVEVELGEKGVKVRLLGKGKAEPFALALLAGSKEAFLPSKHVLGSLSAGWFLPPFPRFGLRGDGELALAEVLPGVGPWVQGKNPHAEFRVQVLR